MAQFNNANHWVDFHLQEAITVSCLTAESSCAKIVTRNRAVFLQPKTCMCQGPNTLDLHNLKRDQEDSKIILRIVRKCPEKTVSPNTGWRCRNRSPWFTKSRYCHFWHFSGRKAFWASLVLYEPSQGWSSHWSLLLPQGKGKAQLQHWLYSDSCTQPLCAYITISKSGFFFRKDLFPSRRVAVHLFTYLAHLSARESITSPQVQSGHWQMSCKSLKGSVQLIKCWKQSQT